MTIPGADRIQARTQELITQGQRATIDLIGVVSDSWADATRQLSSTGASLVPAEVVDRFFDTGVQVLEAQRSMAHGMLDAFGPAPETPTRSR